MYVATSQEGARWAIEPQTAVRLQTNSFEIFFDFICDNVLPECYNWGYKTKNLCWLHLQHFCTPIFIVVALSVIAMVG